MSKRAPTMDPEGRKLATVRRIAEVQPIENADAIEHVRVDGWWCVTKKGEFAIGDLCVYCEIDSVLPEEEWCAFMERRRYHVKTAKIRGALSQGIVFPLSVAVPGLDLVEGLDLTEALGVEKHNPNPGHEYGRTPIGNQAPFPEWISKTDEERIQNVSWMLEVMRSQQISVTEKLDGSSATYAKINGELIVCSRNWQIPEPDDSIYWRIAKKYQMQDLLPEGEIIQGEICGPKVQSNPLGLDEIALFVFNYFQVFEGREVEARPLAEFGERYLCPLTVPIIYQGSGEDFEGLASVDAALSAAEGLYPSGRPREGIVVRVEGARHRGRRLSFKAISNRYLLKAA